MPDKIPAVMEVFKQTLIDLGFSECKPSDMTNSDYWFCACTAMQNYSKILLEDHKEAIKENIKFENDEGGWNEKQTMPSIETAHINFLKDNNL